MDAVKLGLLGGSFNPIHLGHLVMAQAAREQLGLDRVILMPAPRPPHKDPRELAPDRHRLAMARLAARGTPWLRVSDLEFRRRGPSYTIDTVEALGGNLTLIIGQDTLGEIDTWRESRRLRRLVTLAVYRRPGSRARSVKWIDGPRIDVSARDIRARVRAGRSIRFWVPLPVEKYIVAKGLYR